MIELKVSEEQLRKVRLYVENGRTELPKILKNALNRATSKGRTYQSQLIRQGYNVKADVVRGKIKFESSREGFGSWIVQSNKRVALKKFKVNFKNPGAYKKRLAVSVKKGSMHTVPGLFWAHYKSGTGKIGLYYRSGAGRETLKKAYGPSPFQMAVTQDNITREMRECIQKTFYDRFEHEFLRRMKR